MKLYSTLADWWYLLSSPDDYEEEAGLYWNAISKYKSDIKTALELGSGGGNNAFHLKKYCQFTLADISAEMIEMSKRLNPECAHVVGDMRTINLNQVFDLVFIQDAIMYLTTEKELEQVFQVAKNHLKPDGLLFIAPDFFKETFKPSTECGGNDEEGRSIRYLEWTSDSDPTDNIVETEYVYLMRTGGETTCERDTSIEGIFSKKTWEELLEKTGFTVSFELLEHSELEPASYFGISS